MKKITITERVTSFGKYDFDQSVEDNIEMLRMYEDGKHYISFEEGYGPYESDEFVVYRTREETDKEYELRTKKLKIENEKKRKRIAKENKIKLDKERKEYERLKRKYG